MLLLQVEENMLLKQKGRGQEPLTPSPGFDFIVSCESVAIQQRNYFERS